VLLHFVSECDNTLRESLHECKTSYQRHLTRRFAARNFRIGRDISWIPD